MIADGYVDDVRIERINANVAHAYIGKRITKGTIRKPPIGSFPDTTDRSAYIINFRIGWMKSNRRCSTHSVITSVTIGLIDVDPWALYVSLSSFMLKILIRAILLY